MSSNSAPSESAISSLANEKSGLGFQLRRAWYLGQDVVLPVATFVALLIFWEFCVRTFEIPVYLLPAPSVIYTETAAEWSVVWGHTLATLVTVLLGFGFSIIVSLPLGFALTSSRYVSNAIYPLLVLTQSIPKVALAPIRDDVTVITTNSPIESMKLVLEGKADVALLYCNSKGKSASLFVIDPNDVAKGFSNERRYIVKDGDFRVTLWKESGMVYAMVI